MIARLKPYREPVRICIELRAPDRRRRDCDNYYKCVLDLLVKFRIIIDDSRDFVLNVSGFWGDASKGAGATVTITPAGPARS